MIHAYPEVSVSVSSALPRTHGGVDAQGAAPYDFSTNSNACGPCELAWARVRQADASRYPDPQYTTLRAALAQWHGVDDKRILIGASSSELIHRVHLWGRLGGIKTSRQPTPAYGDYAHHAKALGMVVQSRVIQPANRIAAKHTDACAQVATSAGDNAIEWACEPSSPQGLRDAVLTDWMNQGAEADGMAALHRFLDAAYAPLGLTNNQWHADVLQRQHACWQLFSPNKSLGLTGVRAAYAIAPLVAPSAQAVCDRMLAQLQALAPSWPIGAHGVALLQAWVDQEVQHWLAQSRLQLAQWKESQWEICRRMGWLMSDAGLANYGVFQPLPHLLAQATSSPDQATLQHSAQHAAQWAAMLQILRTHGVKLRDTASMGLPWHVRVGVLPPAAQSALHTAWTTAVAHMHQQR